MASTVAILIRADLFCTIDCGIEFCNIMAFGRSVIFRGSRQRLCLLILGVSETTDSETLQPIACRDVLLAAL